MWKILYKLMNMMCTCMQSFRMFASIDILYESNLNLLIFNLYNILLWNNADMDRLSKAIFLRMFVDIKDIMGSNISKI
jgi:hypothetical protein